MKERRAFIGLKDQKAQLGSGITWFVAIIVIFFIMILFLSANIFLSGKKSLGNKNDIFLGERQGSLEQQRELLRILNTLVEFEGKETSIKELIIEWKLRGDKALINSFLEDKIKEIIESDGINKYIFHVESGFDVITVSDKPRTPLRSYSSLDLFLDTEKINIWLYIENE